MEGRPGCSADSIPGFFEQCNQCRAAFFGSCKINGCLHLREHGARGKMAFPDILSGFFYRYGFQPFLVWLSEIQRHLFHSSQNNQVICIELFGKQAACEILVDNSAGTF